MPVSHLLKYLSSFQQDNLFKMIKQAEAYVRSEYKLCSEQPELNHNEICYLIEALFEIFERVPSYSARFEYIFKGLDEQVDKYEYTMYNAEGHQELYAEICDMMCGPDICFYRDREALRAEIHTGEYQF